MGLTRSIPLSPLKFNEYHQRTDGSRFRALRFGFPAVWLVAFYTIFGLADMAFANSGCVVDRYGNTLCPQPNAQCVKDPYGDWYCAGAGGGAVLDRYEKPVCGVGRCIVDSRGDRKCSTVAEGHAGLDRYGEAVCTKACANANRALCHPLRK